MHQLRYFLILSFVCFSSFSMDLETTSSDVFGMLLLHTIKSIGTPELVNKKDIPVIVKNLKALSCASKSLNKKVHDPKIVKQIINGISRRFKIDPMETIGFVTLPIARIWLEKHIQESGEYETFKSLQRLINIKDDVLAEFEPHGLELFPCHEYPPLDYSSKQTEQGLVLTIDSYTDGVVTPWGIFSFGNGGCCQSGDYSFDCFSKAFLKRLHASFAKDSPTHSEKKAENRGYSWGSESKGDYYLGHWEKKLTKDEALAYIGSEELIWHTLCGHKTLYNIRGIKGESNDFPEPKMGEKSQRRNPNTNRMIWKVLEDRYFKETGLMRAVPLEGQGRSPSLFRSIDSAVDTYCQLLAKVAAQPVFESKELCSSNVKLHQELPISSEHDGNIMHALCEETETVLQDRAWKIRHASPQFIEGDYCIALTQNLSRKNVRCSLAEMKHNVKLVLKRMTTYWSLSCLVDYPQIEHVESEEEWYLLIKPRVHGESSLIDHFALAFGLESNVKCSNFWYASNGEAYLCDMLYLWIKKSVYEDVMRLFGFKLTEEKYEFDQIRIDASVELRYGFNPRVQPQEMVENFISDDDDGSLDYDTP